MKDKIKESDKLWYTVGSIDSVSFGISVDNYDVNTEGFPVETSDDATLGEFDSNNLGVSDISKLGGECGCKETTLLDVHEWADEGIHEGGIICTDLVNDE